MDCVDVEERVRPQTPRKRLASHEGTGAPAEAQAWIEKELHFTFASGAIFYRVHIKCGASPKVARPRCKKTPCSMMPFPNG